MSAKIGTYQVQGTLGTGAHSVILHIRRDLDKKPYALKVIKVEEPDDEKYVEQAELEYEVGQKVDHPNLIKIHALEYTRGMFGFGAVKEVKLLIEYVHGQALDKFKIVPLPQLVQICRDVANGLMTLHRRNIVHADLKPNNILLSRNGKVKVIDFGLAWIGGQNKGRVQGTPEYMAPEQVKQKIANERTDIFNLGATMYRLVGWRTIPPLVSSDGKATAGGSEAWEKNLRRVEDLNPNCPPAWADLIHRCLAYKPNLRPERMSDVRDELDDIAKKLVRPGVDELDAWEWPA